MPVNDDDGDRDDEMTMTAAAVVWFVDDDGKGWW
jgi:hypothetical protein